MRSIFPKFAGATLMAASLTACGGDTSSHDDTGYLQSELKGCTKVWQDKTPEQTSVHGLATTSVYKCPSEGIQGDTAPRSHLKIIYQSVNPNKDGQTEIVVHSVSNNFGGEYLLVKNPQILEPK